MNLLRGQARWGQCRKHRSEMISFQKALALQLCYGDIDVNINNQALHHLQKQDSTLNVFVQNILLLNEECSAQIFIKGGGVQKNNGYTLKLLPELV